MTQYPTANEFLPSRLNSRKILQVDSFAPEELAQLARLRYVTDEQPGFTRHCNGKGVCYRTARGTRLRNRHVIKRIQSLAIPPAWTDVWICRFMDGHLQVTGRDDRQRKQYIYHERWRAAANLAKFLRLGQCVDFLPALRDTVARELRGRKLTQQRVLAGMVALLDMTSIRIGNEEYVRENHSYGLATLRNRHIKRERGAVRIRFRGKAGIERDVAIDDKRIVRLLTELMRLPGQHVFQFVDAAGQTRRADATMVNDYLRERTGRSFTAKDFRVWKATAVTAGAFFDHRDLPTRRARKKIIKQVVAEAAALLGNTPTVCRNYYIHAGLLETFEDGSFPEFFQRFSLRPQHQLSRDELILARFLQRWEPSRKVA